MTQVAPQSARRDRRGSGQHGSHAGPPWRETDFPRQGQPTGERLRGRHATSGDQGFGGLVLWTLVGSMLPGAGLLAAGRRGPGRFLVTLSVLAAVGLAALAVFSSPLELALRLVTNTGQLLLLALGIVVLTLLWALMVLSTHRALRRFVSLTGLQAVLSTALVVALVAGGILGAYKAASSSLITRDALEAVTKGTVRPPGSAAPKNNQTDPWAGTPRVNVLLIGSDSGAGREGIRTDSTILASIDTKTGNTVLLGLPRNMQRVPFPEGSPGAGQYPDGFDCTDQNGVPQCLFNALWQYGEEHANDPYYKNSPWKDPGLQATIDGVTAITGLKVDDFLIIDMKGFARFVNAIGGVRINVKRPIPVAGHEDAYGRPVGVKYRIQPGPKRLMGYEALWYARSRVGSDDFDRMGRQRCVIAAVTQQSDPVTLARAFPDIAAAIKDNLRMSIPLDDLGSWVTLAMRVKSGKVTSLPFTPQNVSVSRPDFERIHELVQKALQPPAAKKKKPSSTPPTGGTTPTNPSQAVDVKDAC